MPGYVACFRQELHETVDCRHCAGMRYVNGMMLLVRTTEVASVIELWRKRCAWDVF